MKNINNTYRDINSGDSRQATPRSEQGNRQSGDNRSNQTQGGSNDRTDRSNTSTSQDSE